SCASGLLRAHRSGCGRNRTECAARVRIARYRTLFMHRTSVVGPNLFGLHGLVPNKFGPKSLALVSAPLPRNWHMPCIAFIDQFRGPRYRQAGVTPSLISEGRPLAGERAAIRPGRCARQADNACYIPL